jgi:hypothetical protein
VEESLYVTTVARATGWTEHFIRWELPLSRGWAYYHAQRIHEGERTTWPQVFQKEDETFEEIRKKYEMK